MWDRIIMLLFLFAVVVHAAPYPQNSTATITSPSSTVVVPASITPFTSQLVNPGTTLWISGSVTITPSVPCQIGGIQDCNRSGQPSYTFQDAYSRNYYEGYENSEGLMYNLSNSQRSLLSACDTSYNDAWQGYMSTAPLVFNPTLIPASTSWDSQAATTYLESGYPNVGGYSTSWAVWTELLSTSLGASAAVTTMAGYYTDSLGYKQSTDVGGYWSTYSLEEDIPSGYSTETYTITQAAINQPKYIFPAYYAAYYATPFTFSTPSECCLWCTLFGGTVQVYHWPTTSAPSAVSTMTTLVNAADFTFVSPSVYIAFQSLAATNACGAVGGNDTAATTLAFSSNELSTAPAYALASPRQALPMLELSFTAATWRDATDCASITESFYQNIMYAPSTENILPTAWLTSGSVEADFPLYTVSYNPCSPMISVPTELFSINDAWTGCVPALSAAFFDPPYVLSTGNGLVAFQPTATSNTPVGVPTSGAQPQQSPTPNIPTITTAPVAPIPTSAQSPDPPASDPPATDPAPSPSVASNGPPTQTNPTPIGPAVISLGTTTLTANSASAFILPDSQTLTPGGQVTYSSTVLSVASNGASVIIGGSTTQSLAHASPTQYQIGTQTLIAGAPAVTVSGTVISLAPGGSSIVIDGSTQAIGAIFSSIPEYIVAGSQTLKVGGPAITVSGTVVSLLPGGSSVVVGSSTEALSRFLGASATEVEVGIGGIVQTMGGFAVPTPSLSKSAAQYQGGNGSYNGTIFASGARRRMNVDWLMGIMVGIAGVGWIL